MYKDKTSQFEVIELQNEDISKERWAVSKLDRCYLTSVRFLDKLSTIEMGHDRTVYSRKLFYLFLVKIPILFFLRRYWGLIQQALRFHSVETKWRQKDNVGNVIKSAMSILHAKVVFGKATMLLCTPKKITIVNLACIIVNFMFYLVILIK